MEQRQLQQQWERFRLDIQSIHPSDYVSLAPALASVQSLLNPGLSYANALRALDYYSFLFEDYLRQHAVTRSPLVSILNSFIFKELQFDFEPMQEPLSNEVCHRLFFEPGLRGRKCPLILGQFLYAYLGQQKGLPIAPLNSRSSQLLKWDREGSTSYIHIGLYGEVLTSSRFVKIFNSEKAHQRTPDASKLSALSTIDFLKAYILILLESYHCYAKDDAEKIILLSCLIELDPNDLPSLLKRGLSYYYSGERDQARQDLKKYFSFMGLSDATPEAKCAYYDLCKQTPFIFKTQTTRFTNQNLLH